MLVFGSYETAPGIGFDPVAMGVKKFYLFNLFSICDKGIRLENLIPQPLPPIEVVASPDQTAFDMMYSNFLTSNQYAFLDLMKMMYPLYEDTSTMIYVMVGLDDYRDAITQSLMKFIQERYGYISNYISSLEDLSFLVPSDFSSRGIMNFDADKELYIAISLNNGLLQIPKED